MAKKGGGEVGRGNNTCLKEARDSLLADLVARPARHRSVIHFRSRCVVQPRAVKLLVLFQTLGDCGTSGRRYVGVSRLRHVDQFTRIVESPVKGQRLGMTLHRAHERHGFLLQRPHHHLALAFFAHRGVCNGKRKIQFQ